MKKLIFTLLLSTAPICSWAQKAQDSEEHAQAPTTPTQETEEHTHKANSSVEIPNDGSLVIDWGFNSLKDCLQAMPLSFWGSRFSNVCAYYNIRLGQSHFTISPGIGVGFEGYQFNKQGGQYNALVRNAASRDTELQDARKLFPASDEILQSSLDVRYWDLNLEARFSANNKYPKEGFSIALGCKLGMLWKASTTIKYKEDDQIKQRNDVESFNLNPMRFGVNARLGWGRFGLLYTQTLSALFREGKGPNKTTTRPYGLGLSIDLF